MRSDFSGNIVSVRAVEDCIRSSKKYTESLFTKFSKPEEPIQGAEFASRVLSKRYEVYPDVEVGWDMSVIDAVFWLADCPAHIDVRFQYYYTQNRARITIYGNDGVVQLLRDSIPGMAAALDTVTPDRAGLAVDAQTAPELQGETRPQASRQASRL